MISHLAKAVISTPTPKPRNGRLRDETLRPCSVELRTRPAAEVSSAAAPGTLISLTEVRRTPRVKEEDLTVQLRGERAVCSACRAKCCTTLKIHSAEVLRGLSTRSSLSLYPCLLLPPARIPARLSVIIYTCTAESAGVSYIIPTQSGWGHAARRQKPTTMAQVACLARS